MISKAYTLPVCGLPYETSIIKPNTGHPIPNGNGYHTKTKSQYPMPLGMGCENSNPHTPQATCPITVHLLATYPPILIPAYRHILPTA